jgi:parallel beta-helix repeat protein
MKKQYAFLLVSLLFPFFLFAQPDVQKALQRKFLQAKDGEVIELPAGKTLLMSALWLDGKKNITLQGKGTKETILSFKGQVDGAEGLKITNCENITVKDLCIMDAKGDGIKIQDTKNITCLNMKVGWSGKPSLKNGGYCYYPVNCDNVVLDKCEAQGASDAGIYVGQSRKVVVKNCYAHHNVAGIEIENCVDAEAFDNEAVNNTGGILVFDMPGLVQKKGGNVRVFKNKIHDNNYKNFASKGNIVGQVPDGTGIMILATNHVEVYENQILNNKTLGVGIVSFLITEREFSDKEYYPYPTAIKIYKNVFQRKMSFPTLKFKMGKLMALKFGKNVPHIIFDGIRDPKTQDEKGNFKSEYQICIHDNENESFSDIDAEHDFKGLTRELKGFDCK